MWADLYQEDTQADCLSNVQWLQVLLFPVLKNEKEDV